MKKQKNIIEAPLGETKVLLHTCCAPCSSAIIEAMMKNGITPVIYYCNPNIYPVEEYEIRKNECKRYAEALGLEIVDADYDHDNWLLQMKGLEDEPERGGRCLKCFKFRLLRTAEYARDHGIKVITTTLASSRWKSLDQINEAGFWACDQVTNRYLSTETSVSVDNPHNSRHLSTETPVSVDKTNDGPVWWPYNWKKGGLQERRLQIIKEYDFYNQQYCGCEFSMRNK
ncbi:MAG: epoxyqueuosine reductase QueH [Bacteroidales bacterium]|nr:epoxyqueuosine reductase QueH [Bacteroidales bacterium]MBQ8856464.1 epoxyqueuosine reductase QueH [Bacteroidales bacterium]